MRKTILSGIIVSLSMLFILLLSTLIVTRTKYIYTYSIEKLNLIENVSMPKAEILENYSYVVDYILNDNENFNLPTLPQSSDGAFHFKEVQNLFSIAKYSVPILFSIIILLFTIYFRYYKNLKPIKTIGIILTTLPIIVTLILSFNFQFFFTVFHKILFNNDKWLLDPLTDPIIYILPEEFFAFCGVCIIILCVITGIALWIGYNLTSNSKASKSNFKYPLHN